MPTLGPKKGETMRRIYAVLHRNPDLTSAEVRAHLPDLTDSALYSALKKNGAVEVRGKRQLRSDGTRAASYDVYHVKYKSGAIPKAKTKRKVKAKAKVKAVPVAPKVEVSRNDSAQELFRLQQHNRILHELTRELALDLATARLDLSEAKRRRSWWAAVKEWFA